ncbi:MAG: hypothetical protein ACFHXK_11705 [bacterium]
MGIDRVRTTLPAYTSVQRRSRVRKGKSSIEDDVAGDSHQDTDRKPGNKSAPDKSEAAEPGKNNFSEKDRGGDDGGHIDERV